MKCSTENIAISTQIPHPPSLQMPFMSSYGGVASNIISSLGGFHTQSEIGNFQLGTGGSNATNLNNILSIESGEIWRLPFLAGFEVPNNTNFLYQSEVAIEATASSMLEREGGRGLWCAVVQSKRNLGFKLKLLILECF
ncbi:hypothetical protein Hdeb2414_s0023g00638931 [Helianthus debilis subsp. tardiflorus]